MEEFDCIFCTQIITFCLEALLCGGCNRWQHCHCHTSVDRGGRCHANNPNVPACSKQKVACNNYIAFVTFILYVGDKYVCIYQRLINTYYKTQIYNKCSLECCKMNTHHTELQTCIKSVIEELCNLKLEILLYLHNLFICVQSQLISKAAIFM